MKKIKILLLILIITIYNTYNAYSRDWYKEYKVIAVYIFNLFEYVEWKDKKVKTVCILNDKKVFETLSLISIKYSFKVSDITSYTKLDECSILYVNKSYNKEINSIIENSNKKSLLTISTIPKFIDKGGIIGIISIGDKTGLEINYTQSKKIGIKISADLLEVAKRIH